MVRASTAKFDLQQLRIFSIAKNEKSEEGIEPSPWAWVK